VKPCAVEVIVTVCPIVALDKRAVALTEVAFPPGGSGAGAGVGGGGGE
jgi:hypothetical protein